MSAEVIASALSFVEAGGSSGQSPEFSNFFHPSPTTVPPPVRRCSNEQAKD
jgi:hypothetical protein